MSTWIGTTSMVEQPARHGFSQTRGPYTARSWEGPSTGLDALLAQLSGWDYDVEYLPAGKVRVTATIAQEYTGGGTQVDNPQDVWELFPNVVEKDILEADIAAIQNLSDSEREDVRYWVETPQEGKSPYFGDNGTTNETTQNTLYGLMSKGVKTWTLYQPVMRHTRIVPYSYGLQDAASNVGKILKTSTLTSTEGAPSDMLVSLPTTGASNASGLSYGWLKTYPTVQETPRGFQVVNEYQWGLWSTFLYGSLV